MNDENLELGKWEPGQSGNPKGRPKGAQSMKTILNRFLSIDSGQKHPDTGDSLTYYELAALKQIDRMIVADLPSFKEVVDRVEGQAKQTLELSNMNEEEIDAKLKDLLGDSYKPTE